MTLHQLRDHLEVVYGAALALAIVMVFTPAVAGMARRLGAVDVPDDRRVHRIPIPRLGGLAMFFGIIVPSLAFLDLTRPVRGLLVGAAVATGVGAIDDFRGLAWWEKLAGQILAGSIPPIFGIWIDHFTFPFLGVYDLPVWLGGPLTVLWIVAVMNMVNFLDGLDGLAAGVCGIAGFTFALIALSLGKPTAAAFSAIVLGATLGFLRHNFFPARVFMGDSGSMLLGFSLAAVSVEGLLKTAATVALFFPLLVLAVPILDTGFVVARRLKYRMPITTPDKTHLHHRFVNIGFSQPRAVLYIYFWVVTLAAAALGTRYIPFREDGRWHTWPTVGAAALGLLAVSASVYMVYLLEIVKLANPRIRRRRRKAEERERRSA
jgi:UDP-GlcNAc:undecaprenyl-phosphate/decaprenyl-phosphate GlcNAc-1-phosphate transferase